MKAALAAGVLCALSGLTGVAEAAGLYFSERGVRPLGGVSPAQRPENEAR